MNLGLSLGHPGPETNTPDSSDSMNNTAVVTSDNTAAKLKLESPQTHQYLGTLVSGCRKRRRGAMTLISLSDSSELRFGSSSSLGHIICS